MSWRGSQEAYWMYGVELAGRLPGSATSITAPACPTLGAVGISSLPSVQNGENPVQLYSIGSYKLLTTRKGIRDYTINADLTIGNSGLLRYALRSSGLGTTGYKGLPALAMGIGALDTYGEGFAWLARYCFIQDLNFTFQVGQPVTCQVTLIPQYLDFLETDAQATALMEAVNTETAILAATGGVLAWDNLETQMDVGGSRAVDFSEYMESISVRFSNQIDRAGQRRDKGDDNPLSRIRQALVPLNESCSVSYVMGDKLANAFRTGSCNSTDWGKTILHAHNDDNGCSGTDSLKITLDHNRLSSEQMQGTQAGQRMKFTAETISGFITID